MKEFAKAIKLAAKIREESFDHKKADEMEKSKFLVKNFEHCYTKNLHQAVKEAAEKSGFDDVAAMPIYFLLKYAWDDILDWANKLV